VIYFWRGPMTENPYNTPIHSKPLPFLHVSGSHHEIGRQIGEGCRQAVRHSVENARQLLADAYEELELTWDGARLQARKYMPFAQERYPQYVDEMAGIAEGANLPFDDITALNAMEAVTMDALHLVSCTSLAVNEMHTVDGHILLAHNEDWLPDDEPDAYVVHVKPDDEPAFLAMSYGGLLPNVGFNAHGIAQLIDSVHPQDSRIGIPRLVVARAVLAANSPTDAIKRAVVVQRAAGYNHLIAHESGEIYSVEVSARRFAIVYANDGIMAHTNNFLSPRMQEIECEPERLISSQLGYFRTLRLLRSTEKHTVESLQAIQKDHVDFPNSICNHAISDSSPLDREKTINAMVIDLTAREMHIAWGNPCQNKYHTFRLDE